MSLKYRNHFRRWLWERVRLPKIEKQYHPNNLIKILNGISDNATENEFLDIIEEW